METKAGQEAVCSAYWSPFPHLEKGFIMSFSWLCWQFCSSFDVCYTGFKANTCANLKGVLRHSWQGLRQSCWSHREIAGCDRFWLACCMGKIRWHGGVVEDWGVKGFSRPIVLNIFFSFEGNCLGASKYNLWYFLSGCVRVCVHIYLPDRRHKKEGGEVNGKVALCTCICVYVRGSFSNPQRKKVSFLSVLVFQGGWKQSSNGICSRGALEPNQHPSDPNGPQESFCGEGSLMPITPHTHIHTHINQVFSYGLG